MNEEKHIHIEQKIIAESGATIKGAKQVVIVRERPYGMIFQAPPLPEHFVSRPEVTDILKARLLSEEPTTSGILVVSAIHGLGGIGKSTLAAALAYDEEIQERFPDGILWKTLGQTPNILPLLEDWIINGLRDYDFHPTTPESASAHLRTLLQDKAVLLIVDDVWDPKHAIHFKVGGPRCQVLITTRRADVADEVGAELYQMDVMTPEQSLELLAARLGKKEWEEAEQAEALRLAEAVGYLPLALELAAVRVTRGTSWMDLLQALEQEIAALDALESSPRKRRKKNTILEASFNLSLNALRSDDEEAWQAFVWLGVLPEDVQIAVPMAATLWNVPETETVDILAFLWNDALLLPVPGLLIGEKEWPSYRVHDLLHDLARKLLTTDQPNGLGLLLKEAHAGLLERYKLQTQNGLWHTLADDGYIHAHLTWHFQQAGQTKQIQALLREESAEGRNGWFQVRERLNQTAGFLEDVNLAYQMAEQDQKIGLQCRYALLIATFNSLAQNIPGALLHALVQHGLWSPAQGLAYARQVPDPKVRTEAFLQLIPGLPQTFRDMALRDALTAAQAIQDERSRAKALTGLVPYLPEALCTAVLKEALTAAQAIQDAWSRAEALTRLAPHLPEALLREAWTAAQSIQNEFSRAEALTGLAPHLPEALLREAWTAAQSIQNEWGGVWALTGLVPHLPEALRTDVLREVLTAAQAIQNEGERSGTLTGLAPYLPEALLREVLTAAQAIQDEWSRAEALTRLAPHLPEALRPAVLREALTAAQAILFEWSRAEALTRLAPHLPAVLLREALTAAQAIQNELSRAEALTGLAPHLPEALRTDVLQEALTAAQAIRGKGDRAAALTALVPHLPEALCTAALQEVLVAAQAIQDEGERAAALTALAPHLPEALLQEALTAAQAIQNKKKRAAALTALAPHLPEALRPAVLQEALTAAQTILDEEDRVEALIGLAPHLPEALLQKALTAAQAIPDEWGRAEVLTRLAPHLPAVLLREALTAAQAIQNELSRVWALTGLVPYLPEALCTIVLQEALTAAQAIPDEGDRAATLTVLAPHLPEALRTVVLQEALTAAQAIPDEGDRAAALTVLAPYLPAELLREALTAAQAIPDEGDRAEVLTMLAPHLAEALRTVVLQEALTAAQAIPDEWIRARALTGLAPHLPEELRPAVLREALTTAQAIPYEWNRPKALDALAQRLVERPVGELLPLWPGLLAHLAQRSRPDLLSDLRALTPVIAKIGGDEATVELFHAIQDVGRWWP